MPEGHTIHRLARDHAKLFAGQVLAVSSPQGRFAEGAERITGTKLLGTDAHGKHLFYRFDGGRIVHVHLGLYGDFTTKSLPVPEPRGALRMRLVGDETYADLRGPTRCELIDLLQRKAVAARLGPDPLRRDADPDAVFGRIAKSKMSIGQLLMDQAVIAGIGNVYRAELLFRHHVNPYKLGKDVSREQFDELWADTKALLIAGVRANRIVTTRPEDRERRTGRPRRVDAVYVYRRAGQPCRWCGHEISVAVMAARNLFWCAGCQTE